MSVIHELSVTRLIHASPERVWDVMTNRIPEWWCPKPWRAKVIELDRRPGGKCRIDMFGPNGEESNNPGFILAWDEGKRFTFTDAIQGDLEPAGPFMIGIFEIAPEGDGTRYTGSARHWSAVSRDQHKAMGFEQGWSAVAEQLAEICEGGDQRAQR